MADNKYYVIEARLPVQVQDALTPEEAARKGATLIMEEYGVDLSNWFIRVFEYGGERDHTGIVTEWFSNPAGTKFRDKDQNIEIQLEMVQTQESENEDD